MRQLLRRLQVHAQQRGIQFHYTANTPYINTMAVDRQPVMPGSREIERSIKSIIRWNAMAMVVRANRRHSGIGGHISTYASCGTLYESGYNEIQNSRKRKAVIDFDRLMNLLGFENYNDLKAAHKK